MGMGDGEPENMQEKGEIVIRKKSRGKT